MSEFTGGIDEEIGVEEKEKSDKITSIEEKKPKRRPFHYWEVGDRRLSLKLNTRMIEILENKYKMNIMNLVAGGDIPPLSVMITVVQAAAAPWTHKLKYEDVQKLYDKWTAAIRSPSTPRSSCRRWWFPVFSRRIRRTVS